MEDKREEKYEARDICLGAGGNRPEREHGRLYRWLDNFWYHHKWAVIAALVALIVLCVCILQMCGREEKGDVTVVTAGPYGFMTDETGLLNLKNCLATYLPGDFNGNGVKDITVHSYTVYSEEEAKALENRVDENGDPAGVKVDRYQNTQEYSAFSQYLTTGDAAILFLSPTLAAEYGTGNALVNFTSILGETPENGVTLKKEDGSVTCYGIKLSETALWRDNSAIRAVLPEDTVICLMMPGLLGNNSDEAKYNEAVQFVKEIIK